MIRALATMAVVALSLGTCLTIVLFSWPDEEPGRHVARRPAPFVISKSMEGADIVPANIETGSIQSEQRRR